MNEDGSQPLETLQEKAELHNSIIEFMADALFVIDEKFTILVANRKLREFNEKFGYDTDIEGKTLRDVYPFITEEILDQYVRVFETGKPISTEEVQFLNGEPFIFETRKEPVFSGDQVVQVTTLMRDITRRKTVEEAYRQSVERYRSLYNKTPVMLHSTDPSFKILSVSDHWLTVMGYQRDEVVGRSFSDFIFEAPNNNRSNKNQDRNQDTTNENDQRMNSPQDSLAESICDGSAKNVPLQVLKKNGEIMDVILSTINDCNEKGDVIRSLAYLIDVTEQKQAEKALRLTQFSMDRVNASVFWITPEGKLIYVNDTTCGDLGYSRDELMELAYADIDPDQSKGTRKGHWGKLKKDGTRLFESYHKRKDGTRFPVEVTSNYLEFEGTEFEFAFAVDITDRKKYEENILLSLSEKEILLREIHHRVKNNLQIISSLLDLQTENIPDPSMVEYFRESQNRISSMAMVHETLYQSEDLGNISSQDYIQNVIDHLSSAYMGSDQSIELHVDIEDIQLDVDRAIPIGIIMNELVSNALKHAFKDRDDGKIEILFTRVSQRKCVLTVADNGGGIPDTIDPASPITLGLELVGLLVKQLNGDLEIQSKNGTSFTISIPDL